MDLIINDLSIHEQFHDRIELQRSFKQLTEMRQVAEKYQRDIKCSQSIFRSKPVPNVELVPAINRIPDLNLKRAILSWLTRNGPFWEEDQEHSRNDWLEYKDELIVTETGIGEAAFRVLHGRYCGLISVCPSKWTYNPIQITWKRDEKGLDTKDASINNWWIPRELDDDLARMSSPIGSWRELAEFSRSRFDGLTFFEESFAPLFRLPFSKSASDRIQRLLNILHSLVRAYDADGNRTGEGHRIYDDYFTGGRAWFSDSSDSEKRQFREELRFSDRNLQIRRLSCTWHGKINYTMPIRLHFSWPIQAGKPLYVVYIGPKKTIR
ncbi:MAG: hypothetical protein F4065_03915 [Rhodothermaceae bacterium]|nr:hypothetical protein [Bacteroidota bacterium]MXW33133.1 hypothetical protein [Rhodothermaceae bacterium]MDE2644670.1 hypothetical protein [Bacteroidota bacterium]MXX95994.1 hypothetical protein [Rhodothermaceae bacterium]MXZ18786.1 hypothetical protein [Rhodothermaceae bacterium]